MNNEDVTDGVSSFLLLEVLNLQKDQTHCRDLPGSCRNPALAAETGDPRASMKNSS